MSDSRRTVVVLADDLMWASRLTAAVERAGAAVVRDGGDVAIVDLGGRTYDGVDAVARLSPTQPVIAVAAHVDVALRKRALAAGARRVYAYSKLFSDGPRIVRELLADRK